MKNDSTQYTLTVATRGKVIETYAPADAKISEVLSGIEGLSFSAPCGGSGRCGKCKIIVTGGRTNPAGDAEKTLLSEEELQSGVRLACLTRIESNLKIELPRDENTANILTRGGAFEGTVDPIVYKVHLKMPQPCLADQRSDFTRLKDALAADYHPLSADSVVLSQLPGIFRASNYKATATLTNNRIIRVEGGNTAHTSLGAAVDIGTTTVVVYLLDLTNGSIIDIASGLNLQGSYGADVISRIDHCMKHEEGLNTLQGKITSQLKEMIKNLTESNNLDPESLDLISIAGNTTMIHLLLGMDPRNIAAAPFVPVSVDPLSVCAAEARLDINSHCRAIILPSVSGYVGADIIAGILSTGIDRREKLSLLIDLGTNGEIALGNRDAILCCATAAGPAFEGAHISCGMGGIGGAINYIGIENGALSYTTIGQTAPAGICGSGILDTTALLVRFGAVDKRGKLLDPGNHVPAAGDTSGTRFPLEASTLLNRKRTTDNGSEILLVDKTKTQHGQDIVFTQKDIREVQLAKGAVAGGVETLLGEAGIEHHDVETVYIAGGFGSYVSAESAHIVGLIPDEFAGRVEVAGNTAGQGAIAAALSKDEFERCMNITRKTRYVELSTSELFLKEYRKNMYFRT